MSFSEEEIRRAAELKLWIESRIAELQGEIEKLKEAQAVVDSVLKKTSFKTAAELKIGAVPVPPRPVEVEARKIEEPAEVIKEVKPLKRTKNGYLLANAHISPTQVAIVPADDVKLNSSTPPFKSFFVNRILEGMRGKDLEGISDGKLKQSDALAYDIEEKEGSISKIVVRNYRDRNRLNEIINTATWAFTRMLEKKS